MSLRQHGKFNIQKQELAPSEAFPDWTPAFYVLGCQLLPAYLHGRTTCSSANLSKSLYRNTLGLPTASLQISTLVFPTGDEMRRRHARN